jgi:hypothetical protein
MGTFLERTRKLGIPAPDATEALVLRLHSAFSAYSAAKNEVFVPLGVGTKKGTEGNHHRWLRALLYVAARDLGFTEPFRFHGCSPDVLCLHKEARCLLVGDAKNARHQRAVDSEGPIGRYFDRTRAALRDGQAATAIAAIVTDDIKASVEWMGLSRLASTRGLAVIPRTTMAMVAGDAVTWVITTAVRLPT